MCEFCVKHGEGKKWYLNVKNYSHDLLSDINRNKFVSDHFYWIDKNYKGVYSIVKKLPLNFPIIGPSVRAIIKSVFMYKHWGQIVPIEDVGKILNFTNSITRVPCICRKIRTGKEVRACFLISLNPEKMGIAEIIDKTYFKGPDLAKFEKVDKNWTLDFIKENEKRGWISIVWGIRAPFIGILCNCDYQGGCIALQMIKEAAPLTFRAEYIAQIDERRCVTCGECAKVCQFNAISVKNNKEIVINKKCYGCGACRAVCKKNAIFLKERHPITNLGKSW